MMQINWPLIIVLFCLSLPGVLIAVPRLIYLLLPENSEQLKKRLSKLAVAQTLLMVFLMCLAGAVLSVRTGLDATLLDSLLQGKSIRGDIAGILPVFLYTIGGLVVFFILYYGVVGSILDEASLQIMRRIRAVLHLDGCILYGGVVEEILGRWGLMNVIAFFAIFFAGEKTPLVMWSAIFLSGLLLTAGHIPAYLAAGCQSSRRFIYAMLLLHGWQAILFGWLFWQYGFIATVVAHMVFHLGWYLYDRT